MRLRPVVPAAAMFMLIAAAPLRGAPAEPVPVNDPIEAELRVLETVDPAPLARWITLAQPGTRPFPRAALLGRSAPPESLGAVRAITVARIARALERDAVAEWSTGTWRSTPRLIQRPDAGEGGLELSVGLGGSGEVARGAEARVTSGSGVQVRATAMADRWLVHTHTLFGQVDRARSFADPIVANTDLVAYTEETWVATGGAHWAARFGRSRWAWGPGEEGSLLLSSSAPAITGLSFEASLPALRLHAIAMDATLAPSSGEQLAAHRLEWRASPALDLGLTETARYRAGGWRPLYAVGAIPYILVQRLEWQDDPDSATALRNNIMIGFDAAWRIVEGTRAYGEVLVDDLHAKTAEIPDKLAYQVGWDGAGAIGRSRVTWNGEFTRVSRWTYTSFFGREHAVHGEPLGFPTGPDARRLRVRVSWDPNADWQVTARAARTDRGEGALDRPYAPGAGTPVGSTFAFSGVIERTRDAELGVRWWPASGVDVGIAAGWTWVDDASHVRGATRDGPRGTLTLNLWR